MSERKTEDFVREILKANNDYKNTAEQLRKKLLNGKTGIPEFTLFSNNICLVIECKKDIEKHKAGITQLKGYINAYASDYATVGIAVSGSDANIAIDTFLKLDNSSKIENLKLNKILSMPEYATLISNKLNPVVKSDLNTVSRELHELIRSHCSILSHDAPMFIAGIVIALQNQEFLGTYEKYNNTTFSKHLLSALYDQLEYTGMPKGKVETIKRCYGFIATSETLNKSKIIQGEDIVPVKFITRFIAKNMLQHISEFDFAGKLYREFLSYSLGDGKELGIVLTPQHIAEFMCELVDLRPSDVVLDATAGTGGFLIAAMRNMLAQCNTEDERKNVKQNNLIGVELKEHLYALAFANMHFNHDGKSNLYLGDCFSKDIVNAVKDKATVCLLNPPYSQGKKDNTLSEISFINHTLNLLRIGGRAAYIVPTSTFTKDDKFTLEMKKKLLDNHTLEAVIAMPTDLFKGHADTQTCIVIFEAHKRHNTKFKKVLFAKLQDDFIWSRSGRVDSGNWSTIKKNWIELFLNKDSKVLSDYTYTTIDSDSEWCYEAFMLTDYSASKVGLDLKSKIFEFNFISQFGRDLSKMSTEEVLHEIGNVR